MDGDVLEVVIRLVDYLGVNQTAERLGVSPEHLKEVVVGGAEFDAETIAIIDEVASAIADAMDRAGITDEAISAAPELAPAEELEKGLESVAIRMPVLNEVGAEQSLHVDGSVSMASLDRLYELRLIALRRQRDMTLSDSEILEYKIMVTDYELQIIWDMGGTLPVQGGRWSQEHREQEAEKRLNELHRLRRERARADAGLRGLLRRLAGRHEQRRQNIEDAPAAGSKYHMTTTYPRECARCGQGKPPWFKYCPKCYAIVQIEQLQPNTCGEPDCSEVIDDERYLCRTHWQHLRDGRISECPECGEYKPASFPLCRRCNTQSANQPAHRPPTNRPHRAQAEMVVSNNRRAYDHHDAEDAKAKDKRHWFNRQDNGVCNYCGNRYPYDELEMEHMIPRELGGPDHRRNMQLACGTCNRKKGTSTDLEFRQLNADLIPLDERKPPRRPIDPEKLQSGTQGARYRDQPAAGSRTANYRSNRPGKPRH